MAQRVKISTLAAAAPPAPPGLTMQELSKGIIETFWRPSLERVWPDEPDLIVLPEMCGRYAGWSEDQLAEYSDINEQPVLEFFQHMARVHRCYIACPLMRRLPDGSRRNSVVLLDRQGEVAGTYDKNHVVIEETTKMGVLCGSEAPIIECDFGRVACVICFDLNFDELRQNYARARPDLILFSSMYHGGLMQSYWAYSCRAHFVAAVAGLPSSVIAPTGEILATTTNYFDFVTKTINLDCRLVHLDYNGEKLIALKKKYGPIVTITDPGYLGSVLITSETEDCSVSEMISEFEIELLDDYLLRARAHHGCAGVPL